MRESGLSYLNRAAIFSLLSLLLQYPSDDTIKALIKANREKLIENLLKPLVKSDDLLEHLIEEIKEMNKEDKILNLRKEYTRLFISSFPKVPCPPYESIYVSQERIVMTDEVEDILNLINRWGLKLSDNFKDLPEHVAVELELASFLSKELTELTDKESMEIAEKDYITLLNHLRRWIPKFEECVKRESREEFYRVVVEVVSKVIGSEYLEITRLKQA